MGLCSSSVTPASAFEENGNIYRRWKVSGRNLVQMDSIATGMTDAIVFYSEMVQVKGQEGIWNLIDRTELVADSLNPDFEKRFVRPHRSLPTKMRFELYDIDECTYRESQQRSFSQLSSAAGPVSRFSSAESIPEGDEPLDEQSAVEAKIQRGRALEEKRRETGLNGGDGEEGDPQAETETETKTEKPTASEASAVASAAWTDETEVLNGEHTTEDTSKERGEDPAKEEESEGGGGETETAPDEVKEKVGEETEEKTIDEDVEKQEEGQKEEKERQEESDADAPPVPGVLIQKLKRSHARKKSRATSMSTIKSVPEGRKLSTPYELDGVETHRDASLISSLEADPAVLKERGQLLGRNYKPQHQRQLTKEESFYSEEGMELNPNEYKFLMGSVEIMFEQLAAQPIGQPISYPLKSAKKGMRENLARKGSCLVITRLADIDRSALTEA